MCLSHPQFCVFAAIFGVFGIKMKSLKHIKVSIQQKTGILIPVFSFFGIKIPVWENFEKNHSKNDQKPTDFGKIGYHFSEKVSN